MGEATRSDKTDPEGAGDSAAQAKRFNLARSAQAMALQED